MARDFSFLLGSSNTETAQTTTQYERTAKRAWVPFTGLLDSLGINSSELKTGKAKQSRAQAESVDGTRSWEVRHPKFESKFITLSDGSVTNIGGIRISQQDVVPGMSDSIKNHPEDWVYSVDKYGYYQLAKQGFEEEEI